MDEHILLPLLISALASIVVGLTIERARLPVLQARVMVPGRVDLKEGDVVFGKATTYGIEITNKPLSWFLSLFIHRTAARACRATIQFVEHNGLPIELAPMPGRWASSVQPAPLEGMILPSNSRIVIHDEARLNAQSVVDIPAGIPETLDVASHFDGDTDAFGWTNASYRYNGRHPTYRLKPGNYRVRVTIHADGLTYSFDELIVIEKCVATGNTPAAPGSLAPPPSGSLNAPVTESVNRAGS